MKLAYFTVDDGPSPDMGEKVDLLKSKSIPAVWFCRGDYLEQRPQNALYAIQQGFVLGNHSYDHPQFSKLDSADAKGQIARTDKILENIYKTAGTTRSKKYFRFPYGDKGNLALRTELQKFLRDLNYVGPREVKVTYNYYREIANDVDWRWTFNPQEYLIYRTDLPGHRNLGRLPQVLEQVAQNDPENGKGLSFPDSDEIILIHDHEETTGYFKPIVGAIDAQSLNWITP